MELLGKSAACKQSTRAPPYLRKAAPRRRHNPTATINILSSRSTAYKFTRNLTASSRS